MCSGFIKRKLVMGLVYNEMAVLPRRLSFAFISSSFSTDSCFFVNVAIIVARFAHFLGAEN